MKTITLQGQVVDLFAGTVQPGEVVVRGERIAAVHPLPTAPGQCILPGFIDAHVHIESSLLSPAGFAALATPHGTVATLSDPHEIANVLGVEGIRYMRANAAQAPLKCCFGVPSCVPASPFETSGATLDSRTVAELLRDSLYLSEMMNWPGVLAADPEVMAKLNAARALGRRIDGHAPGLRGSQLAAYVAAGIHTDHETTGLDEGREKLALGMKLMLREGSGARNLNALLPLLDEYPQACMLCTDDQHPDLLARGHMNTLVRRAVGAGIKPMKVLRAACLNPVLHYGLPVGLLRVGDPADFIVVDDLKEFTVLQTWIDGQLVAEHGRATFTPSAGERPNHFNAQPVRQEDLALRCGGDRVRVIEAVDGQVFTGVGTARVPRAADGLLRAAPQRDVLKLAVLNRYRPAPVALGFVRGFGLRCGVIASSVAHDAHNVIAAGANDRDLAEAINLVVRHRGGLAYAAGDTCAVLPLPVAGLMSDEDGHEVARAYETLSRQVGSTLQAPYMALSFLALTVIPALKLSDRGLVDSTAFRFTSVGVDD